MQNHPAAIVVVRSHCEDKPERPGGRGGIYLVQPLAGANIELVLVVDACQDRHTLRPIPAGNIDGLISPVIARIGTGKERNCSIAFMPDNCNALATNISE